MGVYYGREKVCQYLNKHTTKNSMKTFFNAGVKLRYCTATSIEGWFQKSDTADVTNMYQMFSSCTNLTTIPAIDTSSVTNMAEMFSSCTNLTTIPAIDTSSVTNMNFMFYSCRSLTSVPAMDTSKVTNMGYMFSGCRSLTSVPAMDTGKVTNTSYIFNVCSSLEEIHMYGMKTSFDISASTKFTREALVEILNNLASVTSATLTMGSTNLAKLTDDDKAIATGKGWTLK